MKKVLCLAVSLFAVGCASLPELDQAATNVVVFNESEQVKNCEFVGDIHAQADRGFDRLYSYETIYKAGINDTKNKTAAIGADTALIVKHDTAGVYHYFVAKAYKC